jgi:histidine ammonia-lyase
MLEVVLTGDDLSPSDLACIAAGAVARLGPGVRARMEASATRYAEPGPRRDALRRKWAWLVGGHAPDDDEAMVEAFVLGHCAGVGDPLPSGHVRALIAARANVLAKGLSGVRPEVVDTLLAMIEHDVVPVVPSQGSVGAAGDLAPLAHVARVACGYGGAAWRRGTLEDAAAAMAGLPVVRPNEKEALALINGATLTAALAGIAVHRARRLLRTAEAACALSMEVCRLDTGCLDLRALGARRHVGAVAVAQSLARWLDGSELVGPGRKPDPFSLRCAPAVLGAAVDALDHVERIVTDELNGACDNPLVFDDGEVVEAGNFHGAPVALAMDHLKIALTQVASIAERRVFRLTYGQLSGLPSFLVQDTGTNSGLMLAQYTAASLVSECKGLAMPASVDSVPTMQHHEDHVSMGPIAARGALEVCELLADVIGIELLCAAQGLDFHVRGLAVDAVGSPTSRTPVSAGRRTTALWTAIRESVAFWDRDRVLHDDLVALGAAVRDGSLVGERTPW